MFLLKEVDELYGKFANSVYQPNILDGKTKELIALACSVMAALAISMSVSAGSKKAKYNSVIEKLEK
ncbi:MAG: hypothetical protein ACYSUV_11185 [Planctomycetota bacterium]|jgi:hypothetical protein